MKTISGISDAATQNFTLTLVDGSKATCVLYWRDQQIGWFLDVAYLPASKTINGLRLVASPNLLRQWRNVLPFGLAFTMPAGGDPLSKESFVSDGATFVLLEGDDLALIEETVFPGL